MLAKIDKIPCKQVRGGELFVGDTVHYEGAFRVVTKATKAKAYLDNGSTLAFSDLVYLVAG